MVCVRFPYLDTLVGLSITREIYFVTSNSITLMIQEFSNYFDSVSLRIAMTIKCKSPLQRLRSIDKNIRDAKLSIVPIHLSNDLKSYFLLLLPTPLRRWAINFAVRPGCTVSSIFPVTDQEIKLEGRKLVELSSIMGPFANSGS